MEITTATMIAIIVLIIHGNRNSKKTNTLLEEFVSMKPILIYRYYITKYPGLERYKARKEKKK